MAEIKPSEKPRKEILYFAWRFAYRKYRECDWSLLPWLEKLCEHQSSGDKVQHFIIKSVNKKRQILVITYNQPILLQNYQIIAGRGD